MKYIALVFMLAGLVSCDNKNDRTANEIPFGASKIVGDWELVETKISPGGPVDWSPAEYKDTYSFALDGTYVYTNLLDGDFSHNGTYSVEENELTLRYISREGANTSSAHYMGLKDNEMILNYIGCIEECSLKFKRVL